MVGKGALRVFLAVFVMAAGLTVGSSAHAGQSPIQQKYQALGGSGGFLGGVVFKEAPVGDGVGRYEVFDNGNIYWSPKSGAHEVHGPILNHYLTFGAPGKLPDGVGSSLAKYPTTDVTDIFSGRFASQFQRMWIFYSSGTGAHGVRGAMLKKYVSLTAQSSSLGLPTIGDYENSNTLGHKTTFEHGNIYFSKATGAHVVTGVILTKYTAASEYFGTGNGFPKNDQIDADTECGGSGLGIAQEFQHSNIYSSSDGDFIVGGLYLSKYLAMGGVCSWGPPTSNVIQGAASSFMRFRGSPGNRLRIFTYGVIPHVQVHELNGLILEEFDLAGGESTIGPPTTDETDTPGFPGGRFNDFHRYTITWSGATGAHEIHDDNGGAASLIRSKWIALGRAAGPLGIPKTDTTNGAFSSQYNEFTGNLGFFPAWIIYGGGQTHAVYGKIAALWNSYAREGGFMGFPLAERRVEPGRSASQRFTGGSIYWKRGDLFAFDVDGAQDAKYRDLGGPSGFLGFPISVTGKFSDGGNFGGSPAYDGTFTNFEHGHIINNTWTTPAYITGGIADFWIGEGGGGPTSEAAETGYPVGDPFHVPGGVFQQFMTRVGLPGGPHGTYLITHAGQTHKIDGGLIECYQQVNEWDGPYGFPISDEVDFSDNGHAAEGALFEAFRHHPNQADHAFINYYPNGDGPNGTCFFSDHQ